MYENYYTYVQVAAQMFEIHCTQDAASDHPIADLPAPPGHAT
jgi:hypothetical protein